MPEYFLILMLLLILAASLHLIYKVKIYKSPIHFLFTNFAGIIVITIWDNFAIFRGHWTFGESYLLGPKIGLMPIEEYLFILIFPYLGLVIFKIFEKIKK